MIRVRIIERRGTTAVSIICVFDGDVDAVDSLLCHA